MKLKFKYNLFIITIFSYLLGLSSCVDDKGNYSYVDEDDIIPVVISGIEGTTKQIGDRIQFTPILENMDNEDNYSYRWYYYSNELVDKTTYDLGSTKNIDIEINGPNTDKYISPGRYTFVFEIKLNDKDVYTRTKLDNVIIRTTKVAAGWYILKSINNQTDFDYLSLNLKFDDEQEFIPDVLRTMTASKNQQLDGEPISIAYQIGYTPLITKPDGTTEKLGSIRALHVASTKDIKTINAISMETIRNKFDEQFYDTPDKINPQNLFVLGKKELGLFNDSLYYSIGISKNEGFYGYSKVGVENAYNYRLHKDVLVTAFGCLAFDIKTCSFFYLRSEFPALAGFAAPPSGMVSVRNMNMDLMSISSAQSVQDIFFNATGHALMKDKNSGEYYLAWLKLNEARYPFTTYEKIPAGAELPQAKVVSSSLKGDFMYFAKDNVLKTYQSVNVSTGAEKILKTFPSNEEIVFVREIVNAITSAWGFRHLNVLTNSANGWKLYIYDLTSETNPGISDKPLKVQEGKGKAHSVLIRY